MVQAKNTMRRIGLALINDKRRAIGCRPVGGENVGTTEKEKADPGLNALDGVETSHSRDLLSVLSNFFYP